MFSWPRSNRSPYPPPERITGPRVLQLYTDRTKQGAFDLLPFEIWWRDRAQLFERHGYKLRPRYQPDWKPSWANTDLHPLSCEDSWFAEEPRVIDATRISDGKRVILKKVSAESPEIALAQWLSAADRLSDSDNHCVPILDYFKDGEEFDSDIGFLVMPFLTRYHVPEFEFVSEVVDFVNQTLHGLVYLHRQNVAHRDLAGPNIMMDADPLFPYSFHPVRQTQNPICTGPSYHISRRESTGVKYYFIDFGISSKFEEGEPHSVVGGDGIDQDVPERSDYHPYNPFPVDIFTLGNLYRTELLSEYQNLNFLGPLADAMTNEDPSARPTAGDALRRFESEVLQKLRFYQLWRPLHPKKRNPFFVALAEVRSLSSQPWFYSKKLAKKCIPKSVTSHRNISSTS